MSGVSGVSDVSGESVSDVMCVSGILASFILTFIQILLVLEILLGRAQNHHFGFHSIQNSVRNMGQHLYPRQLHFVVQELEYRFRQRLQPMFCKPFVLVCFLY